MLQHWVHAGTQIGGRFTVIREIGRGATGIVFEVVHNQTSRRMAIKALFPHVAANRNVMWRFKQEAQVTASIKHANIVSAEVGHEFDQIYFIVQEFLEGSTLRDVLRQRYRLELPETLELLVPIMGALAAAHHKHVVHRDVKPANIFLAHTDPRDLHVVTPKLIDFGLAKIMSERTEGLTRDGAILGTPSYMSPEQARGDRVDARTDIWSIGVVLFEALSGQRPYHEDSVENVLQKIKSEQPWPLSKFAPELPRELVKIVHHALEPDVKRRYQSMRELIVDVLRFADSRDPLFSRRHAPSIPHLMNTISLGAYALPEVGSREAAAPAPVNLDFGPGAEESNTYDFYRLAQDALRLNDLGAAIQCAESALSRPEISRASGGRMHLVQGTALRWLGSFADAERHAIDAYRSLDPGTSWWFDALNLISVLCVNLARGKALRAFADELLHAEPNPNVTARCAEIKALCQCAISLVRIDEIGFAQKLIERAQWRAELIPYDDNESPVWLTLAEAEIGLHRNDQVSSHHLMKRAVKVFALLGDEKNESLYRTNVGNALIQLGAFAHAEPELRRAIEIAEAKQLYVLAPAQANLAFALTRLGRPKEAETVATLALRCCFDQGYMRFVPVCHIYLAESLRLLNRLHEARSSASSAVTSSHSIPAIQAYALATLSRILLLLKDVAGALERASEAMGIFEQLGSLEEGELAIRLALIRALEAHGDLTRAARQLNDARRRIKARADLIPDPMWKDYFTNIPEVCEIRRLKLKSAEPGA
ncbi:MAG: serine/threonine-protein kinase [Byssovorax sp.]